MDKESNTPDGLEERIEGSNNIPSMNRNYRRFSSILAPAALAAGIALVPADIVHSNGDKVGDPLLTRLDHENGGGGPVTYKKRKVIRQENNECIGVMISDFESTTSSYTPVPRKHPHNAVDFALTYGTPLIAGVFGTVRDTYTGGRSADGKWVAIDLVGGKYTLVMSHISAALVSKGDKVNPLTLVAKSGNSGLLPDETAHVHYHIGPSSTYGRRKVPVDIGIGSARKIHMFEGYRMNRLNPWGFLTKEVRDSNNNRVPVLRTLTGPEDLQKYPYLKDGTDSAYPVLCDKSPARQVGIPGKQAGVYLRK